MARKRAAGTRDRILDSAARLFQEHGARAVGTQQIIDDCGCGKNLLYREFPSKDDLVVAYLERCQQEWTAVMEDATRPHADDPAGQLVAMVQAVAQPDRRPRLHGLPLPHHPHPVPRRPSRPPGDRPARREPAGSAASGSPNEQGHEIRVTWPTGSC